jgi:hypothetical protein
MSDADRVQRWRQRMREEGKEPMTIWLSRDEKLRLEDLARTWRCTTSAMIEQALAQFHPGSPHVPVTVPDTEQLRALMQEALLETTAVTELVTDIVTATLARDLPILVREAIAGIEYTPVMTPVTDTLSNDTETVRPETPVEAMPASPYETEPAPSLVTEPVPARKGGRPRSAVGQQILDALTAHPEGLSAEELRVHIRAQKPLGDTLAGMRRTGVVEAEKEGREWRYFTLRISDPRPRRKLGFSG